MTPIPARVLFGLSNLIGTVLVSGGVAVWSIPAALVTAGALVIVINFAEALVGGMR